MRRKSTRDCYGNRGYGHCGAGKGMQTESKARLIVLAAKCWRNVREERADDGSENGRKNRRDLARANKKGSAASRRMSRSRSERAKGADREERRDENGNSGTYRRKKRREPFFGRIYRSPIVREFEQLNHRNFISVRPRNITVRFAVARDFASGPAPPSESPPFHGRRPSGI